MDNGTRASVTSGQATPVGNDTGHRRGERAAAMSTARTMIDRYRQRRMISRQNRAIDRALQVAPTQAMRDEIAIFAQHRVF
ncbi:hypothetical protein GCM10025331_27190 [Actinoplanes utahensis]|nr:hypothetical protein Aut01nite_38980 [Actinoplanes utahensis]